MSLSFREHLEKCIKSSRKIDQIVYDLFGIDDGDIQVEPKIIVETLEDLIETGEISNKEKAREIIRELSNKRDRKDEEEEEYEEVDSASEAIEEEESPEKTCQILETLCRVAKVLRKDDAIFCARVRESIKTATERLLDPPVEYSDKPVILTERIHKFFPEVNPTQDQIFEIGRRAKIYYVKKYGEHPPRIERTIDGNKISVNSYTEKTAPKTLDKAIQEIFK
jgi:hypothetical protein